MATSEHTSQNPARIRIGHPKGMLRLFMRFPIWLYRLRLGWLLGKRFLLLEHYGRKTGMLRRAVIEVVDHNPEDGSYVVAAAWGEKSDWFKNSMAKPEVFVTVSTQRFPATARHISKEEAERHLNAYAKRSPAAFKQLGRVLLGKGERDTDELVKTFVVSLPMVEFSPHREGD